MLFLDNIAWKCSDCDKIHLAIPMIHVVTTLDKKEDIPMCVRAFKDIYYKMIVTGPNLN